jgi:antitoxin component of MazEF toxin-antitoxin module
MELFVARLRRVGNSLSVLVPKRALEELRVGEGDQVEVALLHTPERRRRDLESALGSLPGLGPFERERGDRY